MILKGFIKDGTPHALYIGTTTIRLKLKIRIRRNGSSIIRTTAWETQLTDYFAEDNDCSNTDDLRIIKLQLMQHQNQLQITITSASKAIR